MKPNFPHYMPCPKCGHHLNPKPHPDKPDVFYVYCPLCDDGWEIPLSDRQILTELLDYDVDFCENRDCNECQLNADGTSQKCVQYILGMMADYLIANGVGIQKNGEWRQDGVAGYICSTCNNWSANISPYCPECGAKMTNS